MIKNNYRLLTGNILTDYLTGTDIIDICFYKKRALCIFSSFGSSHIKFMTYPMVLLCCYVYIRCYNQYQNHESHTLKNTEFINYIKKKKKNLSVEYVTSLGNTPQNEGIEIVCSVYENFCKDNTLPARNA